jgi:ribosomal protein L18
MTDKITTLAAEAKAEQLAEVKAQQDKGNWLAAYYAGSAVASVERHYRKGAVRKLVAR